MQELQIDGTARGSPAASSWKENVTPRKMLPGFREHLLGLVRGDLDEAWELQLGLGDFRRPDGNLRAILPLQHQARDQTLAVLDRVGERVVLAVELNAADGAEDR